jgi:diguanylate cyclase (GGDEF)-like protein
MHLIDSWLHVPLHDVPISLGPAETQKIPKAWGRLGAEGSQNTEVSLSGKGIMHDEIDLSRTVTGKDPIPGLSNPAGPGTWVLQLGMATLYLASGLLTHYVFLTIGLESVFWPGSGLALAALIGGGKRYAYGVVLGSLALNALLGGSLWQVVTSALAALVEATLGAWLITRNGKSTNLLHTPQGYLRFVAFGLIASLVGALLGLSNHGPLAAYAHPGYLDRLARLWMGDALGIVLIAPLLLSWLQSKTQLTNDRKPTEWLSLIAIACVVGQVIFLDLFSEHLSDTPKGYAMFLVVSWVALRLGTRGVTLVVLLVAAQALTGATLHIGFFANDVERAGLLNYWAYVFVLSIVGMVIATNNKANQVELQLVEKNLESATDGLVVANTELAYQKDEKGKRAAELVVANVELAYQSDQKGKRAAELAVANTELAYQSGEKGKRAAELVVANVALAKNKAQSEAVWKLAFFDALTNLPNRRLLDDRLAQSMAASKRSQNNMALLMLDLDNFKPLNDTHGHVVGDLLLVEVGSRLTACVRRIDTVARFGGDEFVVILNELHTDKSLATEQVRVVAQKIRMSLATPYHLTFSQADGQNTQVTHRCSASIGVVVFVSDACDPVDVMQWADAAMYQAKDAGRNAVKFYDDVHGP